MHASSSCPSCRPWWRLPLLLALVLLAMLIVRGGDFRGSTDDADVPSADGETLQRETGEIVSLMIDSGEGPPRRYEPIPWRKGMTVRDLTRETPRANRRLEVRGEGASAFLQSLDGLANEGAGGRNWTYRVNGAPGDRSFAVYELQPGDTVLWTFDG